MHWQQPTDLLNIEVTCASPLPVGRGLAHETDSSHHHDNLVLGLYSTTTDFRPSLPMVGTYFGVRDNKVGFLSSCECDPQHCQCKKGHVCDLTNYSCILSRVEIAISYVVTLFNIHSHQPGFTIIP